jgi:glutamate--cysteine ligase
MNPWQTVDEIGLQMRKPRYQSMDKHFTKIGPYGRRMMRQTCGMQVNLDFGGTETILAKRYLVANLMSPAATAAFTYSPIVDRKKTDCLSFRAKTWQHLDPTRTGFPKLERIAKELSKEACVQSYLDHVLAAKVVFVESLNHEVPEPSITFADWIKHGYKGVTPTMVDFDTHLSLHFPEVRAKGFLELRSIDCQSRLWQTVPASLCTSLLYDEANLDAALDP